jgi:hypothetical protein
VHQTIRPGFPGRRKDAVHSHIQESFRSGPSPVAASATSSPVRISPDTGLGLRSPQAGFSPSNPLKRLAMGAALLGCALACCPEKVSAQVYSLSFGTVSNFSVTATSGSTTGSYSIAGPSPGFYNYLNISAGPGYGFAIASYFGYFAGDVVGVNIDDNGNVNLSGGATGSFTMNFTASVLFYDIANMDPTPESTTLWNVTGLGSITDGQAFSPGSYTFNFVTTHVGNSSNVIGIAGFVAVPETPASGMPLWTAGLLFAARSLRQRRSRLQGPSSAVHSD